MAPSPNLRIGILTPSSNTALEPLTTSIITSLTPLLLDTTITVHFSRIPVTKISLAADSNAQFAHPTIIAAAQLLADAKVDVIGWSGTSAGWLGFEVDKAMCEAITAATGIPATTSITSLNAALAMLKKGRFGEAGMSVGLVTPYAGDVQAAIMKNYARIGMVIDKEVHLEVTENTKIAEIREDVLDEAVERLVNGGSNVITTFCTNLWAAQRVEFWEAKFDVVVLDTVTTVIWDCLRVLGVDITELNGWGKIFQLT